ncbi:hypothetical protein LCI18_002461 [Fusarium solani-melongenae]|uniref:Uncharacterized protein n=1 Tax=Fusarium solani subsp. cucurbitae TaxID=2747967 RepID=A0ACD3YRE9_FUSSC|nr:hypothetical protein LCI18_002461 [Fusarium solani-melongenae]
MTSPPSTKITKLVLVSPNTPITNCDGKVEFATSNLVIWSDAYRRVEDDSTAGVNGSRYAASADVAHKKTKLAVTLGPDSNYSSVAFQLIGDLRGVVIVNESPCYASKENTVMLSAKHAGIPWGYAGDIQWILIHPKTKTKYLLNKTRVEIYGLSGYLPNFLKNPAVAVEFLRYMALPEPKRDYQNWVATTCMPDFWFRYDTVSGRPRFTTSGLGGSYKLKAWLNTRFTRVTVNCYDQAGIVQIANCLKEGNPANTWAFLKPYGYINKTQLVGQGQSNNPFFQQKLAIRCIDEYDSRRTYFGNHVVIVLGGKVMDATCGPHTALRLGPHTKATLSIRTPSHGHPPELRFSNANWQALAPLLAYELSLQEMRRIIDIGPIGSETSWIFRHQATDALCTLTVNICADHTEAIRNMRAHLSAYQRPLDDVFAPPTPGAAKGQINLEGHNLSVWVRGDTFLVLDASADTAGLNFKHLTTTIDRFLATSSVDRPEHAIVPVLSSLPATIAPVPLGTEFTIRPEASEVGEMDSQSTFGLRDAISA